MQSQEAGTWLPVALSADLPAGVAMPAWTPAGTLALWRSESGRVSAFADRCPHRGMRLSHGFVRGEALSCIYHGWSYGPAGNCLRIPAHPNLAPPEAIRVATQAVEESGGIVWVAPARPTEPPPRLEGVPLRSLSARAEPAAVEVAAGARVDAHGVVALGSGAQPIRLLLCPQAEGQTLIHVLVPECSDAAACIAASRAAESVRRSAETAATVEMAA